MNEIEIPANTCLNKKHVQQGQMAILADAIGPSEMLEFSCRFDHDLFATVADTILMLDTEKWVRGLQSYAGAKADQNTMRLSPVAGVNITFDRHVMTADGFMPKGNLGQYRMQKRIELYKELSRQGKLFVAKSEVNGGGKE